MHEESRNAVVIEEPKEATWAEVSRYEIAHEVGGTRVTVHGRLRSTSCRLVVYQSGVRHHFTYRILQSCNGAVGGDQMVPFTWTTLVANVGPMGVSATFMDGNGEVEVTTRFGIGMKDARLEGGDGPFPLRYSNGGPKVALSGVLTDEGVECPAMRGEDDQLYTLVPRAKMKGFQAGDHVQVSGSFAQVTYCMQGKTIVVESITRI